MSKLLKIIIMMLVIFLSGCVELNKLTSKVSDVTSENVEDITNGLQIKSIEGIADREGIITRLDIWIVNKAGGYNIEFGTIMYGVNKIL